MSSPASVIAFAGDVCIAEGDLSCVALAIEKAAKQKQFRAILAFDAGTGEQLDIDLRSMHEAGEPGHPAVVVAKPPSAGMPRGPGRPKLGVVAREITLLPRHWEWLASQPGGASVALRKLVEHAMRANAGKDRIRAAQNAAYRFMSAMAGNRVGFEDATRALFAGNPATFNRLVDAWPRDIRDHAKKLAADALHGKQSAA